MSKIFIFFLLGMLPFYPVGEDSLQFMIMTKGFIYEWYGRPKPQGCSENMFICMIKFFNFIMRPVFWHLRKRGIHVMLWSPNEEADFGRASVAEAIITDSPQKLINFLEQKNK